MKNILFHRIVKIFENTRCKVETNSKRNIDNIYSKQLFLCVFIVKDPK